MEIKRDCLKSVRALHAKAYPSAQTRLEIAGRRKDVIPPQKKINKAHRFRHTLFSHLI